MHYFLKLFITFSFLSIIFGSIIYVVDPYDKLNSNLLNLKIKGVFDNRTNKFRDIEKNINTYEAFILGSSRGMQLQPSIVEEATGYKTFNYSVFTANPQDYLAMTRHIVQTQKAKLIWIHLDFYALNENMKTSQELFNSPLKDYTNKEFVQNESSMISYFITHYYSFDALRDAYLVLEKNIKGEIQKHYKESGENHRSVQKEPSYKILDEYLTKEYKNYSISAQRLAMLKEIKSLCRQHNIKLILSLSPVSYPHLSMIKNDKNLYLQTIQVKKELCSIFNGYKDFFKDEVQLYSDAKYWMDSVHPSTIMGELISKNIFSEEQNKFGENIICK